MLVWLFDFRGRIGRVRFAAGLSLALLGAVGLLLVTALVTTALHGRSWASVAAALIVILPLLWSLLALQVKRLRDIGLPVLTLPFVVAINLADHFLAVRTGWRFLWPDELTTPISGLVNAALLIAFLAWPGKPKVEATASEPALAARARAQIIFGATAACAIAVTAAGLLVDPWNEAGCPSAAAKGADCSRAGAIGRFYAAVLGIRANNALDRKKPDDALRDLDRLVAIRPNAVFAWNSRGIAHDQRGELRPALADYDHALALVPGYANARTNRAFVRKELQKAALVQAGLMLQSESEEPPTVTDASGSDRASIIKDLQDDLRRTNSVDRVEDCRLVIDYISSAPAGRDSSWGAICTLKHGSRRQAVMACDDWLIGKFTMKYQFTESRPALIEFISRNCPPGG